MDIVNGLRGVKRTVASFSLAALIASTFAIGVAQAQTFPDVNPSDWFYSYVEDLVVLGVVNGSMPAYRPADNVNRAEMAKLVVEAFEIDLVSPATATFKDVAMGTWYFEYVETAYAHGIVGGYKDTEGTLTGFYGPGDSLTREQAAKMIVLGAPLDINTNCGPSFPDLAMNQWSYEYVETLYVNSVIDGYPDGTFGPGKNINRAEIAKIVSNAMAPVLRPCGGFSAGTVEAMSATTVEVCFTGEYDETSAMMVENYMIEDQDGVELAVTDVEATSDPNCVLLTTAAQDSASVYDLLVTDVMDADGMELLSGSATFNGYSVGDLGDLTIRVDGSTPAAASIPNNGANVLYTVFNIEAGADEAIRIDELTITRQGLGLPGDFDSVKLYVNGVQKGSEKTINTSSNSAMFALSGDPIVVPAGSSVLVEVRADMAGAVNSQNSLCIATADDVLAYGESTDEEVPVAGTFALCGNYMSTTSAFVGQITYEIDDYTGDINVGDTDVSVARLKLDVDNVEDTDVTRITFRQRGSADPEDFANATLYVSGTALDVVGTWESDYLTFDLSEAPLFIERGNSKTIELRVDVTGGLGNDVLFDIYRDWHIEGVGRVYHYGVNVVEVGAPPVIAQRDIIGGNLAFALSSNNPTVGDVAAGAEDHLFMAFNMSTGGDGVTVRGLDITVNYTCAVASNENTLQDVKVWRKNTAGDMVVVAGPLDPGNVVCPIGAQARLLTFNDSFDQAAGLTVEYYVTADVENAAVNTNAYNMQLNSATVDAEYLSNGDAVAAADITGGVLNGKDQTVADPTLTVSLAGIPSDRNIVGGQQDVEILNYNFQASSASDLKITSLTLTCNWEDDAGSVDTCTDVFSNLALYSKDGSTLTLLQGGKSFSAGDPATVTFNNVNLLIPAGDTVKVALKANTSTSADGTDDVYFYINAVGDLNAEDEQSNTLAAGQKFIPAFGAFPAEPPLAGTRAVSFVGAGQLTIGISGGTPTDDALLGAATGNKVTQIKFEADENEDIKISKLRLTNVGVDDEPIATVKLYDGATLLGSTTIDGLSQASFTNLNITVPADGQKVIDVVVDTNGVGAGLATSGDNFQVGFNDLTVGLGDTYDNLGVDIKATGTSSGADVTLVDNAVGATTGTFTVYNTLPVLTRTATAVGGGGVNNNMLEFTFAVQGPAGKSGILNGMTVAFAGTCAVPPTTFQLYEGNTMIADAGANLVIVAAEFTNTIGKEVATGSSATLSVRADTSGCGVDETLTANVTAYDFYDGKAQYAPTAAANYFFFDSNPFPLAGFQFKA